MEAFQRGVFAQLALLLFAARPQAGSQDSIPLPAAIENSHYAYQLALGSSNQVEFGLVAGAPAWIRVANGGLIEGTPPSDKANSEAIFSVIVYRSKNGVRGSELQRLPFFDTHRAKQMCSEGWRGETNLHASQVLF
ncbi:MAG: hypothetical protein M3Y72_22290 [Acidobacteriota bacterium]|nr:hypothetical protein [Acidobacteriota bacterium]